jgi:hypothetical protein
VKTDGQCTYACATYHYAAGQCSQGWVCDAAGECLSYVGTPDAPTACPPACVPTTCAAQGATCGDLPDGCGGTLKCGGCSGGDTCGGGGQKNRCGSELQITDAYEVSGTYWVKAYCGESADGALVVEGPSLPAGLQIHFSNRGGYNLAELPYGTSTRRCTTICQHCADQDVGQSVYVTGGGLQSNTVGFHQLGGSTQYTSADCQGGIYGGRVCSAAEKGQCRGNAYPQADWVCDGVCWIDTASICVDGMLH